METLELEPIKTRVHTTEQVLEGLATVASCGGRFKPAADRLGIADTTLSRWRDKYPNRYRQIAERVATEVEADIIVKCREAAIQVSDAEIVAIEETVKRLPELKDPSQVLKNLSTVKGINIDKVLALTGRPIQHIQHHSADELIRTLGQHIRKTGATAPAIDGTATEVG